MSTSDFPNYFLKERGLTMECKNPTTQKGMMTKDVIMTAALGVLCVAVRMVFMIAGGIAPLIWLGSHFIDAILLGPVFMLLVAKVPKGGAVFLVCLLTGLAFLNSGWPVVVTCIVGGLMCEVILGLGNRTSPSLLTLVITYVVFCLSFIGDFFPLWFLGDQFLGQMLSSGMSGEYVETIRSFINGPAITVIVISIIVGALVGAFFGHRLMRKHFSAAQAAPAE